MHTKIVKIARTQQHNLMAGILANFGLNSCMAHISH